MTRRNGFTLIDLLVGLGIVTVLIGLYVPGFHHDKKRVRSMNCISNLKQIGVGLRLFANDHDSLFPAGASQKEGGLLESVSTANSAEHFLRISDELPAPKVLICPHDTRRPAESFSKLRGYNVSYAIFLDSIHDDPTTPLASDRNVELGTAMQTVMNISDPTQASWTDELHYRSGEILFGDGHVQFTNTKRLREAIDPEMRAKEREKRNVQMDTVAKGIGGRWTKLEDINSGTKTNRIAIP